MALSPSGIYKAKMELPSFIIYSPGLQIKDLKFPLPYIYICHQIQIQSQTQTQAQYLWTELFPSDSLSLVAMDD